LAPFLLDIPEQNVKKQASLLLPSNICSSANLSLTGLSQVNPGWQYLFLLDIPEQNVKKQASLLPIFALQQTYPPPTGLSQVNP